MAAERRVFVESPPVRVTIETTTTCNMDCVMCVHSIRDDHHTRPRHLPESLIDRRINECNAPWEWASINTDGGFRVCIFTGRTLGNLAETSPEALWNGPRIPS